MSRLILMFSLCGLALTQLAGCASGQPMSQTQREGVELRRYCEQNPQDTVRCLGFLGFM